MLNILKAKLFPVLPDINGGKKKKKTFINGISSESPSSPVGAL
jgi:hypothetical protein